MIALKLAYNTIEPLLRYCTDNELACALLECHLKTVLRKSYRAKHLRGCGLPFLNLSSCHCSAFLPQFLGADLDGMNTGIGATSTMQASGGCYKEPS
jgi:hypothetical protein